MNLGSPIWTNGQIQFTLTGESGVSYRIESSPDLQSWTAVVTNSDPGITRTIALDAPDDQSFYRASRGPLPLFDAALVAHQSISLNGNLTRVDSYDSSDPAHSTNGMYNAATRKAGGDVASPGGLIQVGNSNINGKLSTGPTAPLPTFGPGGWVGDLDWTGPGIELGWYKTNFNVCYSDVAAPNTTGWLTPTGAGTNVYVLGNDNYFLPGNLTLRTGDYMAVVGNATLYVPGNVSMSVAAAINITPGASLRIYVAGSSTALTTVNTAGNATAFQYYGLPTNTSVTWSTVQNVGTIYAPEASLTLGGGGTSTYTFQGACVVNAVTIYGHFNFHYDENLRNIGPTR